MFGCGGADVAYVAISDICFEHGVPDTAQLLIWSMSLRGGVSGWSGGDGGDGDGPRPTATARRTYTDMIEPPMVMVCASSVTMRHQLTCVNGLSPSPMLISSARTSKVMSTTSFCATDHAVDGAAL